VFTPSIDNLILRAEFTAVAYERFKGGEPNDYLIEIRGTLQIEDEYGNGTPIGSMTGHYLDIAEGNIGSEGHSVFDLFDCHSEEYGDACGALFNPDTGNYWDEFEDVIAHGFDVLIIDEVKLDRHDNHIPLRFLKLIVDTNAPGAGVVIAFKDSGLSNQVLDALQFFPSPRVPDVFILNRSAPFQGAAITNAPSSVDSTAH
jgi:hypothetical protein